MTNLLFVADDEMDHAGGIGNPEAVEIFPELFHFIAAWDTVDFQIRCGGFGVVRFQLQPDIGMAQVRDPIDPEPVRAELENAAFFFFLDQRQPEGVAIKREHLLVGVARAFYRDVRAAGELWTVNVGDHDGISAGALPFRHRLIRRPLLRRPAPSSPLDRARAPGPRAATLFARDNSRSSSCPASRFLSRFRPRDRTRSAARDW